MTFLTHKQHQLCEKNNSSPGNFWQKLEKQNIRKQWPQQSQIIQHSNHCYTKLRKCFNYNRVIHECLVVTRWATNPGIAGSVLHSTIMRFMSQCNQIFGDIIFTSCPIKLKLTSIISTFQTNSGAKFHSNPTTGKEFPHRPPL